LRQLETDLASQYFRSLVGRRLEVLVEGDDPHRPGSVLGTSCRYAPVSFPGHAPALLRRVVPVRAERVDKGVILGTPEAPAEFGGAESDLFRSFGRIPLPIASD
jgi:tRNA A37 methylthiotransferase MiaB